MTSTMLTETWAQRSESVQWALTDRDGNLLGELMVSKDETPQIANDTSRSIRRTVSNLRLMPRPLVDDDDTHFYAEDIEPLTMRVEPSWVLGDETTYPLGVFIWGDDSQVQFSSGDVRLGQLSDLCALLDQPIDNSIGYGQGISVRQAIVEQVRAEGLDESGIDALDMSFGAPVGWAAGRDTRLTVLDGLCKIAGFLPPYFDNTGLLIMRTAPDLATAEPEFSYGSGTSVIPGSAVFSNDLLTAPNRYVVVGGNPDSELVGIFDVPDSAPHSYANTGRRIRKTDTVQGIQNQAQADQAAVALYASDISTFTWLSFDAARVDPRHDTWNVVEYDGVNYREVGWSIECTAGGKMNHALRGTYS